VCVDDERPAVDANVDVLGSDAGHVDDEEVGVLPFEHVDEHRIWQVPSASRKRDIADVWSAEAKKAGGRDTDSSRQCADPVERRRGTCYPDTAIPGHPRSGERVGGREFGGRRPAEGIAGSDRRTPGTVP